MGLSQLQAELTSLRNYFNGKKAEVDAAVAAAVAAAPTTARNFYVDAVAGLDTNLGSSAAPFKSVDRALQAAPSGLLSHIWLHEGQIHQLSADRDLDYSAVQIRRWGNSAAANPVLIPRVYSDGVSNVLTRILLSAAHVLLLQVDVTLPEKLHPGLPWGGSEGLFVTSWTNSAAGSTVKMGGGGGAPSRLTLVQGRGLLRSGAGLAGVYLIAVEVSNATGGGTTAHVAIGDGPLAIGTRDVILGAGTKIISGVSSHPDGYKSIITNYTAASGLI